MGLSCFRAISGIGLGWMGWVGWDLCAGLLYEHRFAVLIKKSVPNFFWCVAPLVREGDLIAALAGVYYWPACNWAAGQGGAQTFWPRLTLLAPQSGAHTIAPHRDPNPTHPLPNPIHL